MNHPTIRIIREEHAALSAMLRSIPLLLAQHRRQGAQPDFAAVRAGALNSHRPHESGWCAYAYTGNSWCASREHVLAPRDETIGRSEGT